MVAVMMIVLLVNSFAQASAVYYGSDTGTLAAEQFSQMSLNFLLPVRWVEHISSLDMLEAICITNSLKYVLASQYYC